VVAAGAKTRSSWQEEPPSRRRVWLRQTFCTPVLWLSFFRWWMRRKLERNPIGWLEQRTWTGRLVTWGWFAVLISIYSTLLTYRGFVQDTNTLQEALAWLLAGSMAMSAAGSFRRERESGVLELLLVSPLSERRIISGRLRGLWGQFLPAFGLLVAVWVYLSSFPPNIYLSNQYLSNRSHPGEVFFFSVMFLTVPVFGLYFSLRCRNFLAAFLCTVAVGLLPPLVLSQGVFMVAYLIFPPAFLGSVPELRWHALAATFQCILAAVCWCGLYRRLKKRAFPLERTEA